MTISDGTMDVERLLAEREWLQRLALRLLGDGQDADDLVQETMRAALESAPTGLDQGGLRAWLTTVARRTSFHAWRSDAHRRARERDAARAEALPSTDDALERASTRRFLVDAVMALDEPLRSALVLRYFEGLTYAEVADHQDVSQVAARKRVSRGIDVLRGRLDARSDGDRAAWMTALAPFAGAARTHAIKASGVIAVQTKTNWMIAVVVAVFGVMGWAVWSGGVERTGEASAIRTDDALADVDEAMPVLDLAPQDERHTGGASEAAAGARGLAREAFPAREASEVGAIEVRVSWESDGAAAMGIAIRLMPWGDGDPFLWRQSAITDESGIARFADVHAGRVTFYLGRGGSGSATVVAGRTTSCAVTVAKGFDIEGRVLDATGEPVPGAIVQVTINGDDADGDLTSRADEEGRYRVRDVSSTMTIAARAPGHAPSVRTKILGKPGGAVELDLALRGAGGRLSGTVTDENGAPLRGARVRISAKVLISAWSSELGFSNVDGRLVRTQPLPVELRTDNAGAFEADGLALTDHTIEVRTAIHAPLEHIVVITEGEQHVLKLQMTLGGVLTGVVTEARQRPAPGARVYVGQVADFGSHQALAGLDGSFRIEGIGGSAVDVQAEHKVLGEAKGHVLVSPDSPAHWEAKLVAGSRASGVVVDESGEPLREWVVSTIGASPSRSRCRATTDESGRFELKGIPSGATGVAVGPPDQPRTGNAVMLPGVLPAFEDLRIVVPVSRIPSGTLTGIVRDAEGKLSSETRIVLTQIECRRGRSVQPGVDGSVRIEGMFAGVWFIRVAAPGRAPWFGAVDVPVSGQADFGTVVLEQGGHVRVLVRQPASSDIVLPDELVVSRLDGLGNEIASERAPLPDGRFGPYPSGPIRLRVSGNGLARMDVEVIVRSQETVEVELTPEAGGVALVRLVWSGQDREPTPMTDPSAIWFVGYRVTDERDRVVAAKPQRNFFRALAVRGLRPGRYTMEAWDVFGRRGSAAFEIDLPMESEPSTPHATITLSR